jgi:cytochrome b561
VRIEAYVMAWNAKNKREGQQPRLDHRCLSAPTIEAGRYTLTAQALHWLTVLLILMILPVAWVMMSLPTGPEQTRMLVFHRSLGVTIFAVAVIGWHGARPILRRPYPATHQESWS